MKRQKRREESGVRKKDGLWISVFCGRGGRAEIFVFGFRNFECREKRGNGKPGKRENGKRETGKREIGERETGERETGEREREKRLTKWEKHDRIK